MTKRKASRKRRSNNFGSDTLKLTGQVTKGLIGVSALQITATALKDLNN